MTLSECIAKVQQLRPSEFDKDDLTGWLNEVEFLAYDQVISRAVLPRPRPMGPPVTVVPDPIGDEPEEPEEEPTEETTETEETSETSEEPEEHIPPADRHYHYRPYNYSIDAERTLLIPDQFKSAYYTYLFAKQDFYLGEIDRYNAEALQFETEFQQFAKWFRRKYRPKEVRHAFTDHRFGPLENGYYDRHLPRP
jgi:hypothetical protein